MLKSFFTDKKGRLAIAQWPNIPITLWAASSLIAFISEGQVKEGFSLLASAALFTWSYLEITSGASPFRRTLGLVVICIVTFNFFN